MKRARLGTAAIGGPRSKGKRLAVNRAEETAEGEALRQMGGAGGEGRVNYGPTMG